MTELYSTDSNGSLSAEEQGAGGARSSAVFSPAPFTSEHVRILRLPGVIDRVGICRASIYQHMNEGTFPKSVSLGLRSVGWIESEIDAWLAERVSASRAAQKI